MLIGSVDVSGVLSGCLEDTKGSLRSASPWDHICAKGKGRSGRSDERPTFRSNRTPGLFKLISIPLDLLQHLLLT